jgi:hypothetical protein
MHLGFVFYLEDRREFITFSTQPEEVTIDGDSWWYGKGKPYQQLLTIGSGIRIPSTGHEGFFWGIAMVIDLDNVKHIQAREHAEAEYVKGVLC